MKRYIVVCHFDLDILEERVNSMIEQGYQPVGGITIKTSNNPGYEGNFYHYWQAMIKSDY